MSTKAETLAALDDTYAAFQQLVSSIDEPRATRRGAVGDWSVVNVLQHIDGWLQEMTGSLQRLARGERATPEGTEYDDDAWNAKFVEVRGDQSRADALTAFESAHARFRAAVEALPQDRFGSGRTTNRIIDEICLSHYPDHQREIEAYLRRAG